MTERSAAHVEHVLVTAEGEDRLHAEIAYHHYLIDGILAGLQRRAAAKDDPIEQRVAETTRELLDDLMAKVYKATERSADG